MIIPQVDTHYFDTVDAEIDAYVAHGTCISNETARTIVAWFSLFNEVFAQAFNGEDVPRYAFIDACYIIAKQHPGNLNAMHALNYWVIKSGQI